MDGKLSLAPTDLQEPRKRILDSGTADDTRLRDVRSSLSAQRHYFGSDIEPEFFLKQSDGITFFEQSFNEPWPADLRHSFDLVHNLVSLPKPGGWIQLMEMNGFTPPNNGPAMTDFARMASEIWMGIKVGDFASQLRSMLEETGLQNVQERLIICNIRGMAKLELHAKSVNGFTGPDAPLTSVARSVPSSFNEEQLDSLPERVDVIVAWGQRA